ncbi:hypothetical protein HK405_012494, partial [Cladochytrium tenue]
HIVVGLPSEPIIAEAGACWMSDDYTRREIVSKFAQSVSRGYMDVGEGGEVVAQLILVLGRDRAMTEAHKEKSTEQRTTQSDEIRAELIKAKDAAKAIYFTGPVPVKDFLASTFNAEFVNTLAAHCAIRSAATGLPDPMKVGRVSFTHFVPLHSRVKDMRHLAVFFARSAAIRCAPNTPGVDLIIPVIMPNAEAKYIIHADNMSYILVQVKNRQDDKEFPTSATHHNSAVRCDLDAMPQHLYLSLYLALGDNRCSHEALEAPDKVRRFSLRKISEEYKKFVNPLGINSSEYQILRSEAKAAFQDKKGWAKTLSGAVRRSRQTSGAVFGLDTNLYPSLASSPLMSLSIVRSLMQMLRSPQNPVDLVTDSKRGQLQRMVYMSDSEKIDIVEGFASPAKIDKVEGPASASGNDQMWTDDDQH